MVGTVLENPQVVSGIVAGLVCSAAIVRLPFVARLVLALSLVVIAITYLYAGPNGLAALLAWIVDRVDRDRAFWSAVLLGKLAGTVLTSSLYHSARRR